MPVPHRCFPCCNIVLYEKDTSGYSDDQNIFLIYIWSLSTVPAHSSLNPLNFLGVESDNGRLLLGE